MRTLRRDDLPDNIRVTEFYFQPGSLLDSALAQQHYVCSNYTHVVRDLLDAGINVLAQLVANPIPRTISRAMFGAWSEGITCHAMQSETR